MSKLKDLLDNQNSHDFVIHQLSNHINSSFYSLFLCLEHYFRLCTLLWISNRFFSSNCKLHFLHLNANYIDINIFQIDKSFDSIIQLRILENFKIVAINIIAPLYFCRFFVPSINNILKVQQHKQKQPITQTITQNKNTKNRNRANKSINNFQNLYFPIIYCIHI